MLLTEPKTHGTSSNSFRRHYMRVEMKVITRLTSRSTLHSRCENVKSSKSILTTDTWMTSVITLIKGIVITEGKKKEKKEPIRRNKHLLQNIVNWEYQQYFWFISVYFTKGNTYGYQIFTSNLYNLFLN